MKIFVDPNVLLDVFQERIPQYDASVSIWDMAERGQLSGFVSAISFNNIYYIISRFRDKKHAARAIKLLRGTFSPVPLDEQILNQAIDSKMSDFEDAIQFFSAVHASADFIITRNSKDFPKSGIPVLTPEEFLAILEVQGK
ncbi:MAG: PIN domain-containing protein [Victivallales bacterium]